MQPMRSLFIFAFWAVSRPSARWPRRRRLRPNEKALAARVEQLLGQVTRSKSGDIIAVDLENRAATERRSEVARRRAEFAEACRVGRWVLPTPGSTISDQARSPRRLAIDQDRHHRRRIGEACCAQETQKARPAARHGDHRQRHGERQQDAGADVSNAAVHADWRCRTRHLAGAKKLRLLDLRGCKISDAGIAHLAPLTGLAALKLRSSGVTDAGLAYLKPMKKLRTLALEDASITDAGLAHSGRPHRARRSRSDARPYRRRRPGAPRRISPSCESCSCAPRTSLATASRTCRI